VSGAEPQPKTNLVHCKAVSKPLVAIILNILTSIQHRCHLSGVQWRRLFVAQRREGVEFSRGWKFTSL